MCLMWMMPAACRLLSTYMITDILVNEEKLREVALPPWPDIWKRRFQDPLRQANIEQFKTKVDDYEEQGFTFDKAVQLAANGDLPYLRKRLGQDYAPSISDGLLRATRGPYSAANT